MPLVTETASNRGRRLLLGLVRTVRSGPFHDGAETAISPFSRGEVLSAQRLWAPPKAKLSSVDLRRWPTRARCRKQLDGEVESLRACGAAGVLTALPRSRPDGESEEQQRCAEGEEGDGLMGVCCFEVRPHACFGPRHLTSRCVPRVIDTRETSRRGVQDRCSTFSNSSSTLVACRTIPCSSVPDPVS